MQSPNIRLRFFMIFVSTSLPQSKKNVCAYVCVCMCVYVCVCPSPIVETKPIRHLGSSCKYLKPLFFFFSFSPNPKINDSSHKKKKIKISIFSKMALTIWIKVCRFIVHSKPKNMTLSAFFGKILETRKIVFNFLSLT